MPKNIYLRTILIIFVIIIIAGFVLPKKYFQTPLKSTTLTIFSPIMNIFQKISNFTIGKLRIFSEIRILTRENAALEEENLRLLAEKTELLELKTENESLKAELNFVEENPKYRIVGANIIGRDPNNFLQYATLDRGERDGARIDMPVTFQGFLVGKITEVGYESSKISFITNPQSVINSMIQESRATGLVKGQLGFSLLLDSIPQDAEMKPGDLVITSGLGGNFPKGLIIGEVDQIKSAQSDIFQQATVKPLIDFTKLEILFIIIS